MDLGQLCWFVLKFSMNAWKCTKQIDLSASVANICDSVFLPVTPCLSMPPSVSLPHEREWRTCLQNWQQFVSLLRHWCPALSPAGGVEILSCLIFVPCLIFDLWDGDLYNLVLQAPHSPIPSYTTSIFFLNSSIISMIQDFYKNIMVEMITFSFAP